MPPLRHEARALLLGIGVGDFNATMIIPYLFIAPSTTDPGMNQIILLTKHVQKALVAMGAPGVRVTGKLDNATGAAITQLSGPGWLTRPWYQLVSDVIKGNEQGFVFRDDSQPDTAMVATSGFDIPDVPGGALTYGVGAAILYYFLIHKKKARK